MEFAPPRGMRDFLPEEMEIREYVIETIKKIYKSHDFRQIQTPALEYLNVLKAKCGEEVKYQIYEIEDMGLRFEFTTGLARFLSNLSIPKPYKVFQIGPVWRRDEPQRGRYREFWQADIDIIGSESKKCDAEVIECISEALSELKIKHTIRINSIKVLDEIIKLIGAEELNEEIKRCLDKISKKGEKEVRKELFEKGLSEGKIRELFKIIKGKGKEINLEEVNEVIDLLKIYGVKNIKIDLSLARGLAYYTGIVFEFEGKENIGSIASGGRYDNLLGLFGASSPAVGGSIGIDRVVELVEVKKEMKKEERDKRIFIANVNEDVYAYAAKLGEEIRKMGLSVSINLTERNLRKQLDYANSMKFDYAIIIGEKEKSKKVLKLKDLSSGKERILKLKEIKKLEKL